MISSVSFNGEDGIKMKIFFGDLEMKVKKILLSCFALMCSSVLADVSESFDYAAGGLGGKTGGVGWGSTWRNNYSRNGGDYVVSDTGLTYVSVPGAGNAAFTPGDGTRFQRDLDITYNEGIVYLSFLMRCVPTVVEDEYVAVELQSGKDADPGRVMQIGVLRKDDGIDPGDGGNDEFFATARSGVGGSILSTAKLADLDGDTHYFVIRFDLDTDTAIVYVDPTTATPVGLGGVELQLYEGFSFDRLGIARFVGENDAFIDEITVNYAGIDNVGPVRGEQEVDPVGLAFEWGAPTDPNIALVNSYAVYADPNLAIVEDGIAAGADFSETNIPGSQTMSSVSNGIEFNSDYYWCVKAQVTFDDNTTGVISSPTWSFRTKLQDIPPVVDAGDNIITTVELAAEPFGLNETVTDDGTTAVDILWEAFEISADGIATTNVVFSDAAAADTTVTILAAGTYVLKLTATDGTGPVSDMVEIRVYEDGCRAAKATGAWQAGYYDTNSDCVVDINDFAMFAVEWLSSTEMTESAAFSATATEPADTNESLLAQVWLNIEGTDVEQLLDAPEYSALPDYSYQVTGELRGKPTGRQSGERISGYLVPPTTGDYTFYIASDDKSRLFLSTDTTPVDTDPAFANHIAEVSEYTDVDQWDLLEGQASAPISLLAGQYYYIEVLHKERQGDNHVSVGWSTDGGTTIEVIPGTALRHNLP